MNYPIWCCSDIELAQRAVPLVRMAPIRKGEKSFNQPIGVSKGGLRIVDVSGVLTKYGMMAPLNGSFGTATVDLTAELNSLKTDPAVSHVFLRIESPGGEVRGIADAADAARELAAVKPVVAWIDSIGTSAAYFIACSANMIVASQDSLIGSIGTILVLADFSEMVNRIGIKFHVFATGSLKGTGSFGSEVTPEQAAYVQGMINDAQRSFDIAVLEGRKLTPDAIKAITPGGVFGVRTAKQLRLIDAVGTFDDAVAALGMPAEALRPKVESPSPSKHLALKADYNRGGYSN